MKPNNDKMKQDITPNANREKKPKKSIADDIEKLKNRREERKKGTDSTKSTGRENL
jgi:hypothetical protein